MNASVADGPPPDAVGAGGASGDFLRSAYSLIANTVVTGALGVAFWVVAARLFSAAEVGRQTVLITTMMTLSTICQLNMANLFLRFLPNHARPGRVILIGYALNCVLAIVVGTIALFVFSAVTDELDALAPGSWLSVVWVASMALWGVFTLQDAALTGLRQAPWVPLENGLFGLLKLIGLPLALTLGVASGIFLAWVIPMMLLVVPISMVVFRRAVARHSPGGDRVDWKAARRYLALDYASSTFIQGLYTALPILVLAIAGSAQNAYFWIPFTLAAAIDQMSRSVGSSLTVEGAFDPENLPHLARTAVCRFGIVIFAGFVFLLVAAPLALAPFGSDYVDNASNVLRVLALSVLCHGLMELYSAIARVHQRGRGLLVIAVFRCVIALGLCIFLGSHFGIVGVAIGWTATSALMVAVTLPTALATLRADTPGPGWWKAAFQVPMIGRTRRQSAG